MAQQTLDRPDADERSRIDRNYDRKFNAAVEGNAHPGVYDQDTNNTANNLNNQENNSSAPDYDKSIADREKDNSGGTWKNNVSGKEEAGNKHYGGKKKSRFGLKGFAKRFGPTGIIGTVLIGGISGLTFTAGPASLLVNLKENFVENHDQQSVTGEIRGRKLLNKRLASKTTSGLCKIKLACRYQKPSNRLLKRLNAEGIKALDANGAEIEKQGFLNGKTRPAQFQLKDGKKVAASEFMQALKDDPEFRRAFRRAHSPRWMNWFDDVAIKFLKKHGIAKSVPDGIKNAKKPDELDKAKEKALTTAGKDKDGVEKVVQEATDDFAKKETKKAKKRAGGDLVLLGAQGACLMSKAPILINKVVRTFRIAQLATIAFAVLSAADKIKDGTATQEEVSNVASLLTQTYEKSDKTKILSAMDSDAMKYGLGLGTGGSDSKYLPTVGESFAEYTKIVSSGLVKGVCSAVGSSEAQAATDAFRAIKSGSLVGFATTVVEYILDQSGLFDILFTQIVSGGMKLFTDNIDWKKLLEYFLGNFAALAKGVDLGDVVAIGAILNFSNLANTGGNLPLTPAQKTAFDEQIKNPVKLAWAQEDRLTHSPFDASNPNTFLGSIVTQFLPYQSSISNPIKTISSIASISTSALGRFLMPASHATKIEGNMCKADYLVSQSGVSSGPLCDVQYGIPAEYMGIEPDDVVNELHESGDLDDDGNPKSDSDLQEWIDSCNADGDTASLSECTVSSRKEALYGLYQIDKRQADGMDNDPPASTSGSSSSSSSSSGSISLPSGEAKEVATSILSNTNITYSDPDLRQEIQDTADGRGATPVALDARLLQVIAAIGNKHTIRITSLGRSVNCSYSVHCLGEAVDIDMIDGVSLNGRDESTLKVLQEIVDNKLLPTGAGIGQKTCPSEDENGIPAPERAAMNDKITAAGYITHEDYCDHMHLALRWTVTAAKTW
ncbi:hypothetical protein EUA66_01125 [TM7 phylum sp. oral taxon 349]|nr:hypothetical protein EUA66_01125 [TM7 phylum sp. oral taxon 349]